MNDLAEGSVLPEGHGWLDPYGAAALGVIAAVFYVARQVTAYVATCGVVVAIAAALSARSSFAAGRLVEWVVLVVGLSLCVFGLLIVRTMLMRSVSLRLLRRIQAGEAPTLGDDLGGRVADMLTFRLIRRAGEAITLTPFGRFISGMMVAFYGLFGIRA